MFTVTLKVVSLLKQYHLDGNEQNSNTGEETLIQIELKGSLNTATLLHS